MGYCPANPFVEHAGRSRTDRGKWLEPGEQAAFLAEMKQIRDEAGAAVLLRPLHLPLLLRPLIRRLRRRSLGGASAWP